MQKPKKVKITFLRKCPFFDEGQEIIIEYDDLFRMMNDKVCVEAWDRINEYVYSAIQSGADMQDLLSGEEIEITCCRESPDPMLYRLELIEE